MSRGQETNDRTRVLVTLEPPLREWVLRKAKDRGVTRSLFVRDILLRAKQEEDERNWPPPRKAEEGDWPTP